MPLNNLSQDFLYAVKTGENPEQFVQELTTVTQDQLMQELDTDAKKIAFWLNVYNGFAQWELKQNPELYKNRKKFYKLQNIEINNEKWSLDDIEHGILRQGQNGKLFGLLPQLSARVLEKQCRPKKLEPRIHFALNCGAKACPPVRFYEPDKLDFQLNMATGNYLSQEVSYDSETNVVAVPAIFKWFKGDFGGKQGIIDFLKTYQALPEEATPIIQFKVYDWSLEVGNFEG